MGPRLWRLELKRGAKMEAGDGWPLRRWKPGSGRAPTGARRPQGTFVEGHQSQPEQLDDPHVSWLLPSAKHSSHSPFWLHCCGGPHLAPGGSLVHDPEEMEA